MKLIKDAYGSACLYFLLGNPNEMSPAIKDLIPTPPLTGHQKLENICSIGWNLKGLYYRIPLFSQNFNLNFFLIENATKTINLKNKN